MNIKLSIYDSNLGKETHSIMPRDSWLGHLDALNELRSIAKDNSIEGWVNEYDLDFSISECSNKHDL